MQTKNTLPTRFFLSIGLSLSCLSTSLAQLVIHHAVELEMPTATNRYYQIQTSSNLVSWVNLGNEVAGTGRTDFRLVSTRNAPQGFYRAVESSTNRLVTIDVASYANLCGKWNYQRTEKETGMITPWAVKVLGTMTEQGHPAYLLQEYDEHGYPNDQSFLYTDLADGLFEMGGLNDYEKVTETKWYLTPFAPELMKNFALGIEYTNSFTHTSMPGTVIVGWIKTERDTVHVPCGTFDCYKVTRTFSVGGQSHVTVAWYAKHIGLIKRDQNDGDLWELISYEP